MKVLVTGAKGLLGREVCRELGAGGSEVVPVDLDDVDLCEREPTLRLATEARPDAVVHCAAWTDVDACEADPDRAFRVNAVAARNAALAARRVGAKILHVSTDYIFSGREPGAYRETDPVGPLSVYGASKEAGERLVREQTPDHFVLRTAWLYGDSPRCFPATIERLARQYGPGGRPLRVVDDQRGTPTWSRELARQIARLLPTEAFGTYHATAQGDTTWYLFARRIIASLGLACEVEPCTTAEFPRPAPRPANSVLDNLFLRVQGLDVLQPWEGAWEEYVAERTSLP
ncbi:MAG: dTDP-4-dehydrorhamnose reductase [Deltaproteobacteria bacterium]|nr:dTDP-4-dehydrorhamnose reductase [Deltaproteobacteria bacterium]